MIKTILILAANPNDEMELSVYAELKALRNLLQPRFKVELSLQTGWNDFNEELLRCNPDIVHFVGHGKSQDGLILEDVGGNGVGVTGDRLAALFRLFPQVECVVMNACWTERVAVEIHRYVPCVIGMSQSIADQAARSFASAFYQAVLEEKGYVWAFGFGKVRIESAIGRLQPSLLMRDGVRAIDDLESPIGRMPVESKFYVERPTAEEDAGREILRSGALIRIKGPREFGKSSLMARMVTQAEAAGAKTVSINFRETDLAALGKLDDFLRYFCDAVTLDLDFEGQLDERRVRALGYKKACGDYFQTVLLPQISGSLVLELDEVDVLLDSHVEKAWIADFFSMLRVWHDDKMKSHPVWKKLRLVLVHSRHIDTLPERQSPFNVGQEIELQEFTSSQVVELARRHRVGETIAIELLGLVGGHPQLIRRGLYGIARGQVSLAQLRENGATEAGFYGQHLEQIGRRIEQDADLKTVVRMVLAGGESAVTIDHHHKAKLRSFGWVVFHGNGVRIACELYRQYFKGLGL